METRDAYANLALADHLRAAKLTGRDAAFATELVDGTSRGTRHLGSRVGPASCQTSRQTPAGSPGGVAHGGTSGLAVRVRQGAAVASSVDLAEFRSLGVTSLAPVCDRVVSQYPQPCRVGCRDRRTRCPTSWPLRTFIPPGSLRSLSGPSGCRRGEAPPC